MERKTTIPTKSVLDIAKNSFMDVETADVYFVFNVDQLIKIYWQQVVQYFD